MKCYQPFFAVIYETGKFHARVGTGKSCTIDLKEFAENCMQSTLDTRSYPCTAPKRVERSQLRKVLVDEGQEVVEDLSLGTGDQPTFLVGQIGEGSKDISPRDLSDWTVKLNWLIVKIDIARLTIIGRFVKF